MRSSSVLSGSSARYGQGVEPEAAEVGGPAWAMSAITIARDVVPFGVDTIVVCNQSGALSGIRFWKKFEPVTPFGKRCSSVGRSRTVRMIGVSTAR